MDSKEILVALSVKFDGDFTSMLSFMETRQDISEEEVKDLCLKVKSKYITILDDDYPEYLKRIYQPPLVLFYYGDISLINNIETNLAVVGSRDYSEYGKKVTIDMVSTLPNEYVIVSGLAKGIDSIAHKSALSSNKKTIAVLGSGIDFPYPVNNKDIYEEIKENGLVISEYPNRSSPEKEHFPKRNRIIAAISKGILITEAHERSGTLITINWGLSLSREIMCVPYPIYEDDVCNRIIKDGATLVTSSDDIIYALK